MYKKQREMMGKVRQGIHKYSNLKGKERKGKERKGKERKGKSQVSPCGACCAECSINLTN